MKRRDFLYAAAAAPTTGLAAPRRQALAGIVDPLFADIASQSPGFAVAVLREGEVRYARGYGLANLDDRIPISADTAFHLASLSKQFTAAAVALLILDGRLDLDTPLGDLLPQAAHYGPTLRVAHLVYMCSGLVDYTATSRLSGMPWQSFYYFTRDEAIERTLAQPELDFAPGERWAYSNVNYMILSRVVEIVSGARFSDFMAQRLFVPLGMTSSFIDDDTTRVVGARAVGYAARSDALEAKAAELGLRVTTGPGFARMNRVSPHFGGSGVFSTLNDLAHWDAALTHPRIGESGFSALMTTTRRFQHDKADDAFGLVMGRFQGRPMIWYSGGDLDTSTWMGRFPDSRTTLVCLSNLSTDNAERRGLALARAMAHEGLL